MIDLLTQIAQKAIELSLPELLKWIIASGVLMKVGASGLPKVYEIIKQKYNEGKYAFVPNKEEAETLKSLSDKAAYRNFKKILPGHWGVDVIRTGCYILILEKKKAVERIEEIKKQIFNNRKLTGLRLVEMVQVGVIRAVLDHLMMLKDKNNYSKEDLENEFENLLNEWKKITIFVKNEDTIDNIKKQAKDMIDRKEETFFILAKGHAMSIACKILVELQKDEYLLEKGYIWFVEVNTDTEPITYYCGIHSSTFLI